MTYMHTIALVLLIVGGINWGLSAFGLNLVNLLFGAWPVVEQIVYVLVALSAIYVAVTHNWGTTQAQA